MNAGCMRDHRDVENVKNLGFLAIFVLPLVKRDLGGRTRTDGANPFAIRPVGHNLARDAATALKSSSGIHAAPNKDCGPGYTTSLSQCRRTKAEP